VPPGRVRAPPHGVGDERDVRRGVEVVGDGVQVETGDVEPVGTGERDRRRQVLLGEPERGRGAGHPVAAAGAFTGPVDAQRHRRRRSRRRSRRRTGTDPGPGLGEAVQFQEALHVDLRTGVDGRGQFGGCLARPGEHDPVRTPRHGPGQRQFTARGDVEPVDDAGEGL
jgi:hypothetical protein